MAEANNDKAVEIGPDFVIGQKFTYHYGTMHMQVIHPGDSAQKPVRWFGTGGDVVMFYPGAVLVPEPYFGWIYTVQADGKLSYRPGN